MDASEFLSWRKALRYTQAEAAEKLGVSRATIQNWEREFTRVPKMVELACLVLTRRWKKRPEFGPVALIYADEPMWLGPHCPTRAASLQCESYASNEVALRQAIRLSKGLGFCNPFLIERDGGIIWTTRDLLRECKRRRKIGKKDATAASGTN
jgi:DNA-binding XRE family transcriptional regulator